MTKGERTIVLAIFTPRIAEMEYVQGGGMDMAPGMLQLVRGYGDDTRKAASLLRELKLRLIRNRTQCYVVPNLSVLKTLMSPDEGRLDRTRRSIDVACSHHLAWIRTRVLLTRY